MDNTVNKTHEKRSLRHDFTAVETHDLSLQLASKTKELASITEEKSSVSAQYGSRIKEVKATTNKLSNQISDGFEMRDVECDIEFNTPKQGMKTIKPRDGSGAFEEKMTDYDWNLFTQPEEKSIGELLDAERDKLKGKGKAKRGRKRK